MPQMRRVRAYPTSLSQGSHLVAKSLASLWVAGLLGPIREPLASGVCFYSSKPSPNLLLCTVVS